MCQDLLGVAPATEQMLPLCNSALARLQVFQWVGLLCSWPSSQAAAALSDADRDTTKSLDCHTRIYLRRLGVLHCLRVPHRYLRRHPIPSQSSRRPCCLPSRHTHQQSFRQRTSGTSPFRAWQAVLSAASTIPCRGKLHRRRTLRRRHPAAVTGRPMETKVGEDQCQGRRFGRRLPRPLKRSSRSSQHHDQ